MKYRVIWSRIRNTGQDRKAGSIKRDAKRQTVEQARGTEEEWKKGNDLQGKKSQKEKDRIETDSASKDRRGQDRTGKDRTKDKTCRTEKCGNRKFGFIRLPQSQNNCDKNREHCNYIA